MEFGSWVVHSRFGVHGLLPDWLGSRRQVFVAQTRGRKSLDVMISTSTGARLHYKRAFHTYSLNDEAN